VNSTDFGVSIRVDAGVVAVSLQFAARTEYPVSGRSTWFPAAKNAMVTFFSQSIFGFQP
jgi:hypothetical protein